MSTELPHIPDLSGDEIERMQTNLLTEISRVDDTPASIVFLRRPLALLGVAACAAVMLIVSVLTLLPSDEDHPATLLASVTSAVNKSTDTVLHARETRYDDGSVSTLTSEAWVDRSQTGAGRVRGVDTSGQTVVDSASAPQDGKTVRTDVAYNTKTVHVSGDSAITVSPVLPVDATEIRSTEVINGEKTRPLLGTKDGGVLEVWVREKDDLPVRVASVTATVLVVVDYEWLPRTQDSLASLLLPIPADFTKTDQPLPADQITSVPGDALEPVNAGKQTLENLISDLLPAQPPATDPTEITTRVTSVPSTTEAAKPATTTTTSTSIAPTSTAPPPTVGGSGQPRPTTTVTVFTEAPPESDKITINDEFTSAIPNRTCSSTTVDTRVAGVQVVVRTCIGMRRTTTEGGYFIGLAAKSEIYEVANGQTYLTHSYVIRPITLSWIARDGTSGSTTENPHDVNSYASTLPMSATAPELKGSLVVEVYKNDNRSIPLTTLTITMAEYG